MLQTGLEDFEVKAGTHVMFDCHGTLDLYCWDGGKTWVVYGEPEGDAKRHSRATGEVAQALVNAMHHMAQPDVASVLLSDRVLADQGLLSRLLVTAPETAAGTGLWRNGR